jgi:hypothetical protein
MWPYLNKQSCAKPKENIKIKGKEGGTEGERSNKQESVGGKKAKLSFQSKDLR